jgi:hypothetical protein
MAQTLYHEGEQAVQEQAGVMQMAARIANSIRNRLAPSTQIFLRQQRLAVLGSVDAAGWVWAIPLVGPPGFLRAANDQLLQLLVAPNVGAQFGHSLQTNTNVGLLVLDPASKQRVRVNGFVWGGRTLVNAELDVAETSVVSAHSRSARHRHRQARLTSVQPA